MTSEYDNDIEKYKNVKNNGFEMGCLFWNKLIGRTKMHLWYSMVKTFKMRLLWNEYIYSATYDI